MTWRFLPRDITINRKYGVEYLTLWFTYRGLACIFESLIFAQLILQLAL